MRLEIKVKEKTGEPVFHIEVIVDVGGEEGRTCIISHSQDIERNRLARLLGEGSVVDHNLLLSSGNTFSMETCNNLDIYPRNSKLGVVFYLRGSCDCNKDGKVTKEITNNLKFLAEGGELSRRKTEKWFSEIKEGIKIWCERVGFIMETVGDFGKPECPSLFGPPVSNGVWK